MNLPESGICEYKTGDFKAGKGEWTDYPRGVMWAFDERGMKMDDFFGSGYLREDGRYVHDMYLMEVKSPAESKGTWDYYKIIKKLPAEQIWTTKAESKCQYWR